MNKRQLEKHLKQLSMLKEVKDTVNAIVDVKQEIERNRYEITRLVNQERAILKSYDDLLKGAFIWRDWRAERPTKSGLYLVYVMQNKKAAYGLIKIDDKYKGVLFDQNGARLNTDERSIKYWRPLAEVAKWQKVESENRGNKKWLVGG